MSAAEMRPLSRSREVPLLSTARQADDRLVDTSGHALWSESRLEFVADVRTRRRETEALPIPR